MKLTIHFHPMPRLGMHGAMPPFPPTRLDGAVFKFRNSLTLTFTN